MSRTRALAVLALLSTLGLTGCSDDDPEPRFEPTSPTSEAPSSPTTTAAASLDSPEDVVRAWVEARNAALQGGDLTGVRALTTSSCKSCDGILDPIEVVYESGGHFETTGWTVVAAKVRSQRTGRATVSTGLEFAAGRTVQEAGAEPVVYEAEKHVVNFRLTNDGNGWLVDFIGFLS